MLDTEASYSQWVRMTLAGARAAGGSVIPLFDSHPSEPVELLHELMQRHFGGELTDRYTSAFSAGNPFVVAQLMTRYGCSADRVLTTTGATSALRILYAALLQAGDRILVETPGFDVFHDLASELGLGVDTFVRPAPGFTVDPAAVDRAIGLRTRLVVLSSLHNPSGALLDADTLHALANVAERRNVHILVDEVYLPYVDDLDIPPAATLSERLISIGSMTKMYALSSLRCGWIIGSPQVVAAARSVADRTEFGISNLAHAVAALVLENDAPFRDYCQTLARDGIATVRDFYRIWTEEGLIEGEAPRFGCVSFPRVVGAADTTAFAEMLMKDHGVVVAPGRYFGAPAHIRIGHAKPPALLRGALSALTDGLRAWASHPHSETRSVRRAAL